MRPVIAVLLYGAVLLPARAAEVPAAAQAAAPVPAIEYRSAFTGYMPWREQGPTSWREVNDEVARIGGHIGILRGTGHPGHSPAAPPGAAQPGAAK
jgi:hypothetical protein